MVYTRHTVGAGRPFVKHELGRTIAAGSALLGATPGEHLSWPVPGGKEQQVELLALEPAEA